VYEDQVSLAHAFCIEDLRRLARRRLPRAVFDFIDGGAESETTLRRNALDFDGITFAPRVLVDVQHRQLAAPVLGVVSRLPLIVAPTGLAALVWPRADVALARAAHASGIPFTVSTSSSVRLESIREAVPEMRLWFQVYLYKDRELVRSLVARALQARFEALVLTVDAPVLGQRHRDLRNRFTVPLRPTMRLLWDLCRCPRWTVHLARQGVPKMQNLIDGTRTDVSIASLASLMTRNLDASVSWNDAAWLRDLWPGKLVLKGILSPEDAQRAARLGFDAVVVSNHGGRQLDCAPSAIAVLGQVIAAAGDRIEVYLDGGVRRGSDIAKALALGARAVMIGRATLFGVAAGGEAGARQALAILAEELDRCLALIGCPSVTELDGRFVRRGDSSAGGCSPG
jgi:(S)-mandelate dehydrogenase